MLNTTDVVLQLQVRNAKEAHAAAAQLLEREPFEVAGQNFAARSCLIHVRVHDELMHSILHTSGDGTQEPC